MMEGAVCIGEHVPRRRGSLDRMEYLNFPKSFAVFSVQNNTNFAQEWWVHVESRRVNAGGTLCRREDEVSDFAPETAFFSSKRANNDGDLRLINIYPFLRFLLLFFFLITAYDVLIISPARSVCPGSCTTMHGHSERACGPCQWRVVARRRRVHTGVSSMYVTAKG